MINHTFARGEQAMWAIWDADANDWLRELPSKVDDGGIAVLVFTSRLEARRRAAQHFGFDTYDEAAKNGWTIVVEIASPATLAGPPAKVVRK